MQRQKDGLSAYFAELSDEDLQAKTAALPWGEEVTLARALLDLSHACLIAYRMQLFLHAKAAGNADIGTPNCWAGVDMPAQS